MPKQQTERQVPTGIVIAAVAVLVLFLVGLGWTYFKPQPVYVGPATAPPGAMALPPGAVPGSVPPAALPGATARK